MEEIQKGQQKRRSHPAFRSKFFQEFVSSSMNKSEKNKNIKNYQLQNSQGK